MANTFPAGGEVYRWTDDNGKLHFSDRRPENAKATSVEMPSTHTKKGISTFANTRQVVTNKPIPLTGSSGRRVKFDKLVVDLIKSPGVVQALGHTFSGQTCKSRSDGSIYLKRNQAEVSSKAYKSHFAKLLKDNGYNIVDDGLQIFAGMDRKPEELQVAAVIKEMELNRCYRNNKAKQISVADYMRIEWKVYDPLNREIVFETESEGSSRETYSIDSPMVVGFGGLGAFDSAIQNLLAQPNFVSVLSHVALESVIVPTKPLIIRLANDRTKQMFTEQVDQLKAGTVTVRSPHGHGSGFVIGSDGYVVTNAHVVGKAVQVLVFADDQRYHAQVVREDIRRDVALLKLEEHTSALPALVLAENGIGVGQSVYLIGTPLEESLGHTVTRGIISAERELEDGQRYYQTDAAINPGNSGGPAFSDQGKVVGIAVSGLFHSSGGSLNINFLIPIDEVIDALHIRGG
ncbi:MAG: trypsin-like peptidase domain-containing protein [Candidatus Thiodiazotropha endolucinida]|nr:trypsin-like peptidase domain-containing protein [Candidatus Thiodiazotropha taylori]MCW4350769.1 trypsin-like peptidase domain-containing protein [Candidatus Thiodiazotropha endolucinida]